MKNNMQVEQLVRDRHKQFCHPDCDQIKNNSEYLKERVDTDFKVSVLKKTFCNFSSVKTF